MIEEKIEMDKISDNVPPIPHSKLEEDGHALLIVDLLRLPKTYNYKRYRIDMLGFLLGWLWVVLLLALGYWLTRIGA